MLFIDAMSGEEHRDVRCPDHDLRVDERRGRRCGNDAGVPRRGSDHGSVGALGTVEAGGGVDVSAPVQRGRRCLARRPEEMTLPGAGAGS